MHLYWLRELNLVVLISEVELIGNLEYEVFIQ